MRLMIPRPNFAREGARRMLATVLVAEADACFSLHFTT